jgi:hypothetical protein
MIYLERLYGELLEERRITKIEPRTLPFYNFNSNLGGALIIPTLVYGPDSDDDHSFRDSFLLHGLAIAQIITSLETYYIDIFLLLTNNIKTSQIEPTILSKFVTKNRLSNDLIRKYGENRNMEFPLSDLIPKYFPLQEKDRIKASFQLFELDPTLYETEWVRTFGDLEDSTIQQRHKFVHSGINYDNSSLSGNELLDIKARIKDAMVLVYCIEKQIREKTSIQKINGLYS